jgi:hypothetical protein
VSGFHFYIVCNACGLTSPGYPFRYDSVVAPTQVVLPAANRRSATFERVAIPVTDRLDDGALARLAAEHSSAEVTVCVPMPGRAIVLQPAIACPRCQRAEIECRYGQPSRPERLVESLDEVIDQTREIPLGAYAAFAMPSRAVLFNCTRRLDERGLEIRWHVERRGDVDIAPIVDELVDRLARRGSTCSAPQRMRAFTRFEERP